jgi:site-specific recombinase XerD
MSTPLLNLEELRDSWLRQLRGQRKSKHTLKVYRTAVDSLLAHCDQAGTPAELTKATVLDWMAAQQQNASTVRLRLMAIKCFARWLADEEGFDADGVLAVKPPNVSQAPVADMSEDEITRMVKTCDGTALNHKRDKAILLLLTETGLRASELLALAVTDVDLDACLLVVRKGKGGKTRRVKFSAATSAAIDRYVRARHRVVRRPTEGPLWVSTKQGPLTYPGLVNALKARAAAAGVVGFHVHRLRHTAAVRWLQNGGSETGLRAHCGWDDASMIARYTKAASERLAAEEFERLGLGLREL